MSHRSSIDSTSSGSSSEKGETHTSSINLPHLDFDHIRRQNQGSSSKPKLAKATQNLAKATIIKKSKRKYPDSYRPQNPKKTMAATPGDTSYSTSSESEMEDDDRLDSLARFQFQNLNTQPILNRSESDSEDSDSLPHSNHLPMPPREIYSSDDDDYYNEDEDYVDPRSPNRAIDITDQAADLNSVHSKSSLSRNSRPPTNSRTNSVPGNSKGIKGILRRMTVLSESMHEPPNDLSRNDTFLARMFSFGGSSSNGLSGGGLAPGASNFSRPTGSDAEKRVGFDEDTEYGIEMQPLGISDLSEEARQLISQHVPEANGLGEPAKRRPSTRKGAYTHGHLPENQRLEDVQEEASSSSDNSSNYSRRKSTVHHNDQGYYAPNPDIFLRDDNLDESTTDYLQDLNGEFIDRPQQVQAGVLSSLLRLYQNPLANRSSASNFSKQSVTSDSGSEYYDSSKAALSMDVLMGVSKLPKNLLNKAHRKLKSKTNIETVEMDSDNEYEQTDEDDLEKEDYQLPSFQNAKPKKAPKMKKSTHDTPKYKFKQKKREERLKITVHIAGILQRQRFIMKMCRALMLYGAPTHRLEEYMTMTSRVLEIDGQFIYFPGCMLVSFGDAATRTSEVHLIRCTQGLNLWKLNETHRIYKAVIHDLIGVETATKKLDDLMKERNLYPPWACVLFYGLGAVSVTPFAFEGGWIDVPICFVIGLCVGFLQFYVSRMSNLYSSVFEVSAAIVVSFLARGIASIKNGDIFCFSAIVQGSLALILPGFIILCGSLELQSRNIVAGSVRMFYAIIYSLFLGFGITLGASLYGWVDDNAVLDNSCRPGHAMDDKFRILFVPMFALCLGLINQAHWRQTPTMIIIAATGYVGTYFAGIHFSEVTEFTACIGAFIVGILGNLYSRIWKGMAVSAMLPAIFVQVPLGIASKGSLISGIQTADHITQKNGTQTTNAMDLAGSLSFGATMVEVAIGISVGLFAAALIVYPFGKKRTGLFSL